MKSLAYSKKFIEVLNLSDQKDSYNNIENLENITHRKW